jgi:hypothetical protein
LASLPAPFLPFLVPRFGAFSASNAFIVGALLRPALDCVIAAGAVEGGGIKASSISSSSSSFSSSSSSGVGKDRRTGVVAAAAVAIEVGTAAAADSWEEGGGGGEGSAERVNPVINKAIKAILAL